MALALALLPSVCQQPVQPLGPSVDKQRVCVVQMLEGHWGLGGS